MDVKKYLKIVGTVTLICFVFVLGTFVYQGYNMYVNPLFSGANMPDGDSDEDVKGLEEVEKSQAYNVLVLGVDTEAKLTDVMMLCRIDTVNKQINMLSIPRDTKVVVRGSTMKINSSFSYGGVEQVIKSVKTLTGLPVHHYMLINTAAFRDVIDALGGVDFNVPQNMDYEDPLQNLYIHLKKGYQHLDGDKAEQLVRFRRYTNGDIDRIKVQQDFLSAIVEQKLSAAYVLKIPEVYEIISKNTSTDMTGREMLAAGKQILSIGKENFNSYTVPGEGTYIGEVSYYVHYSQQLENLVNEVFISDDDAE